MRSSKIKFTSLLMATSLFVAAGSVVAKAEDYKQESLSLTIYQDNFAQVNSSRSFNINSETETIRWEKLPTTIQHDSFVLSSDNQTIADIRRPLMVRGPGSIMEQFIGQTLVWYDDTAVNPELTEREGKLLAVTGEGVVVEFEEGIEVDPYGKARLPYAPTTVLPYPHVDVTLANPQAGKSNFKASYLTEDLYWIAQYKAVIDQNMKNLTLNSMIQVGNLTERDFTIDKLSLVAGDTKIENNQRPMMQKAGRAEMAMMSAAPSADMVPIVQPSISLSDRYVFPVEGTKELPAETEIKFNFFEPVTFPVKTSYELDWRMPWGVVSRQNAPVMRPNTVVEFENSDENGLGMALPEGNIRFVADGGDTNLGELFVSEEYMQNTAKGQDLKFHLGQAFDITAKHIQTDFRNLTDDHRRFETSYDVKLTNAKDEAVTVILRDFMPSTVEVLDANAEYEKTSAQSVAWTVEIPANGEFTLSYRVQVGK
ncbi:DUF4139 domain-containing protein [Curvivirga sp.]|uniref:DUF4139 domain-containing protein n=1 Tax=Curvivirga sp. TaxID=2856848 RepID=UPI003B5A8491